MNIAVPTSSAIPLTADFLFENSPDCAKLLDLQGNLLSMNRNGQCLMDVDDLSQICGLPWVSLWPGEPRQQIELALEQARQGQLGQFTAFCPTAKGVPKFWDVRVTPIHGADGQLQGFLSVSRDITTLQELLRARERAGILADAQKVAMEQVVSGASLEQVLGTIVRAAEAYSEGAMLVSVLLAQDGRLRHGAAPSLPQAYVAAIDGMATGPNAGSCGTAAHFNQEVVASDIATDPLWQDYKDLALSHGLRSCWSQPIRSPRGAVLGTLACYRREVHVPTAKEKEAVALLVNTAALILDHRRVLEERQTTQEALRQSEERYRLSIEASGNIGTWAVDPETNITVMDAGLAELFGIDPAAAHEGAQMSHFTERIHAEDRPLVLEAVAHAIETAGRYEIDHRIVHPSGKVVWVAAKGKMFTDKKTGTKRFAGVAVDITERKQTHEDLRRLAARLSEADHRKTEFLATLAHELRNPLAPIQNGLEVLRLAGNNPETAAKVRGMMQRQVSHMVHLVEDLLDVARINSGKVELRKEKVELKSIVTHAVESNLAAMEAAHHVLDLRITDESLVVDADPVRLVQVLGNLLTNAAKYTPEYGRIELSVRRDEQHAVIAVTDNGIGIALHAMPSLFDMFTQVPSGAARSQGGLGIGLSLVQRLVAMHGGTVTAASPGEGQGSTFTVRLPVVDQPQVNARPSQNQVAPIGKIASRLKVLVADDNIDAAESLAALLALCGHETTVAHDGHAALRWVVEGRPDVAFLDIGMPGLTGYEVARMVRQTSGVDQTVLVALTGWGADHDQDQARQAGFNHHLTKPADIAAIDALLAAHSARAAT